MFKSLQFPHVALVLSLLTSCGQPPNNPYPEQDSGKSILYTSFEERPKHLDPARAYSSNEIEIISEVYEPLLQYAYLKRPYQLEPLAAAEMPRVRFLDARLQPLATDAPESAIAFSEYSLTLRPDLRFQPHPAFATAPNGQHRYHQLTAEQLADIDTLADFADTGSRPVTAADYAYQIKRLVHPAVHSPIAEMMSGYIVGLKELGEKLATDYKERGDDAGFFDLRAYDLAGVRIVDDQHLTIRLNGKYPQFRFWLAMPFFAPMPWEADAFYAQPGLIAKNMVLDWYPVGSGPYVLIENNPNRRMVLERNPNYHLDTYPTVGEPDDATNGLLADAGRRLPIIDRVIFTLEKETIPYWNKFLQGYYDASGIASDNFDQAIQFSGQGNAELTDEMRAKNIQLLTATETSIFYLGFNMLDPVVGGLDERKAKLRRAISLAIDQEEFISIFLNGRGIAAQGVLPPGLFGYAEGQAGINPNLYDWSEGEPRRKPLGEARRLLAEAGYPKGVETATGKPLVLYLDTTSSGPDDKPVLSWYRKQFEKLGIQLVLRTTDYNQFQQKMSAGNAQLFRWGWNADYPDPENFFFLLYGENAKVGKGGENAANYHNPDFDRLFETMRNMDDTEQRAALIQQMQDILRRDSPWAFGFHRQSYGLHHDWYRNRKTNLMANNGLKYLRIDVASREARRAEWNRPRYWPLALLLPLGLLAIWPAYAAYRTWLRSSPL